MKTVVLMFAIMLGISGCAHNYYREALHNSGYYVPPDK